MDNGNEDNPFRSEHTLPYLENTAPSQLLEDSIPRLVNAHVLVTGPHRAGSQTVITSASRKDLTADGEELDESDLEDVFAEATDEGPAAKWAADDGYPTQESEYPTLQYQPRIRAPGAHELDATPEPLACDNALQQLALAPAPQQADSSSSPARLRLRVSLLALSFVAMFVAGGVCLAVILSLMPENVALAQPPPAQTKPVLDQTAAEIPQPVVTPIRFAATGEELAH